MTYLKLAKILIVVLPEFLALVKMLMERHEDALTDEKIKADMKGITDAFKNKDAAALNAIFNS